MQDLIIRLIIWLLELLGETPAYVLVKNQHGTETIVPMDGGVKLNDGNLLVFTIKNDLNEENNNE